MKHQIEMAERAKDIVLGVAVGELPITHIYTDDCPDDGRGQWTLEIRTIKGQVLTFLMEDCNIATLHELVDTDGHRLIGRHNPIAVVSWLTGIVAADLDQTVLIALAQAYPKYDFISKQLDR